jgi:choline-glycine betaine transporter
MRADENVTHMATRSTQTERTVRRVLLPLFLLSGVLVVAGFFFPWFVGSVVSGQGWLVLALVFFGTGLSYVSLLPGASSGEPDPHPGAPYFLRLRRRGLRDALRSFAGRQDPVTFGIPVLVFTGYFLARWAFPRGTSAAVNALRDVVLLEFGWVFLGTMFLAVLFAVALVVGPWGRIKLGGPDAEPTYTYPVYASLFFTAGIAAGIVFWGPAEALFHYQSPPPYFGAPPQSGAAIVDALTYALFHWGVSAWSAYLVIGLPIAYFVHQRDAPLRVSTLLTPYLGVENLDSGWADLVDTLAIFATIGGVGTSVAFVSQQFLTGINFQWGVTYGELGPLLFVTGLTLIYVIAAESGIHRGVRRIAGATVVLFVVFMLLVLAVGPRGFILAQGSAALGRYVGNFVPMSLHLGGEWVAAWTVWNWSWWFSWAPFAGLFLAAISRGRRVRTVVLTGVFATSAATILWFLVLGGTSLALQHDGTADILGTIEAHGGSEAVAGFPIFAALPISELLMFLFLALIIVFIVTSAAVSTLVVSVLGTKRTRAPSAGTIAFWGVLQGAVAVSVLLVGGGETLQAMAVLSGGPFAVISLLAIAGLALAFRRGPSAEPTDRTPLTTSVLDRFPVRGRARDRSDTTTDERE